MRVCRSSAPGGRVPPMYCAVRGDRALRPVCPGRRGDRSGSSMLTNRRKAQHDIREPRTINNSKRLDRFASYPLLVIGSIHP